MMYLKYIVLALAIFQYAVADSCGGIIGNLNDCFTKEAPVKSYGCCGLKLKYNQYYTQQMCVPAPKTKAGREFYMKQILRSYHIEDKSNVEFVCPEADTEVKGYCTDYAAAMLDNGSDCFGLSLDNLKGQVDTSAYSCCYIKNNKDTDDYSSPLPPHVNLCLPLQKDAASREEYMKKWIAAVQERYGKTLPFTFDDLTIECGN